MEWGANFAALLNNERVGHCRGILRQIKRLIKNNPKPPALMVFFVPLSAQNP
jgi:hypothetical protein